ncbi:unnamed protein product [Scytosiphon promiscuus]
MPRTMVASSTSSSDPASRMKRRSPAETSFAAVSPPAESLSSEEDDATSAGFSTSTEAALAQCGMDLFDLQNPSAPPLSRGGSTASWTVRHRRKRSDSNSSHDVSGHRALHCLRRRKADRSWPRAARGTGKLDPRPLFGIVLALFFGGGIFSSKRKQTDGAGVTAPRTGCVIRQLRPIMSRHCRDNIPVRETLQPVDTEVDGTGACCDTAPSRLPCLASVLPCCVYPEELEHARRESSYLVIRDSSVEFNNPKVAMGPRPAATNASSAKGAAHEGQGQMYSGACGRWWCCTFHIRDDARVLYFDDPVFADVTAVTGRGCCGSGTRGGGGPGLLLLLRRFLCGGRSQAVRVQSRACCGACVGSRGMTGGLPCLPVCLVCLCPPAALRYDIPAKDAVMAAAKIIEARDSALAKMREEGDAHAAVPYDRT